MDRGSLPPLRSLPRTFIPGADPSGPIELPHSEVEKLRKVLRLSEGDPIAVLPNDGTVIRCEFRHRQAFPINAETPLTESLRAVIVAQALPKGDRIETVIRMCTEIGIKGFVFFGADRSVVKWDAAKRAERLRRLQAIAQEAAEQSYRTRIPEIEFELDLEGVLNRCPAAIVLSEVEGVERRFPGDVSDAVVVVGPEGGWSPRELALVGDRGVTLGPRVLRTDTAAAAAAALLLLRAETR